MQDYSNTDNFDSPKNLKQSRINFQSNQSSSSPIGISKNNKKAYKENKEKENKEK